MPGYVEPGESDAEDLIRPGTAPVASDGSSLAVSRASQRAARTLPLTADVGAPSVLATETPAPYNASMPFDGRKLARIRKAAGCTQGDLAMALRIDRVTVSDIERGERRPGTGLAQRIADELSVPLEDLQTPEPPPSGSADMRFQYTVSGLPTGTAVTREEMEKVALEQVEANDGERETGLWNLTMVYSRTDRHQEAIACLEQLLDDDDDPEKRGSCYLALGQTMEKMRDYAAACRYYRRALLHEPLNTPTWYYIHNNLGYSLSQLGAHQEALPLLRQAAKIAPDRPNAYKNIGMALEALGRHAEAATCYISATQVDASDGRSLGLLETMVEAHPELLVDVPELQQQLEACREAVRVAAEQRPDFIAHWEAMRREQQREAGPGSNKHDDGGTDPDHDPSDDSG